MKLARRRFLPLAGAAVALPFFSRMLQAKDYPVRPVRIMLGFPAGSSSDILARLIGQWLSDRLGQPFVVENRPGASTNLATEAVVRAPPDGHTLLFVTAANAINAALYDKLSFSFIRDISPVAGFSRTPLVMVVNPTLPVRTVPEFIAHAKTNPGQVAMASPGIGTVQHVAGELFKMMAGVDMLHVRYRGSPQAFTDLLAGQVHVMFDVVPFSLPHIRAGKLHPLAVTPATRLNVLPDVPTVAEFLPGYEATGWTGIGAPKATPDEIGATLNQEINAMLADPAIKARFAELGVTSIAGAQADFSRLIVDETDKWTKVITSAGIKPES